jgi:membrane-associated phospholipid phosphatase
MKQNLAKIISYLFVPPINLIIIFIILSDQIYIDSQLKLVSIFIALIFGLILPVAVFVYLRKKKKIVNDDATIKGERTLPYAIGAGLAINALVLSIIFGLHPLIIALWIAYILIQFIMLIINLYWKISAHLIGVGIPYATLLFLFQTEYIYLILIPIIIGWARFTLKVHTPMQIVAGFLLGTIPTYLILNESIKLL